MKLSVKFFCIAYLTVLFAAGAGGTVIVKTVTDTLWDAQIERVENAAGYAADCFVAMAESGLGYAAISTAEAERYLKNALDARLYGVSVYSGEDAEARYPALENDGGQNKFYESGGRFMLESACRTDVNGRRYCVAVIADLTETREQCDSFRRAYALAVLAISAASGAVLFVLTERATRPLRRLTRITDGIAGGSYGATVKIKCRDAETARLAASVNAMSKAIETKVRELEAEMEKRSVFVADFTHELKTPMTAIIGYAQMLDAYDLEPAERRQAARAIYKEGRRLEKLSMQLLELYVLQNEAPETEPFSLCEAEEQLKNTLAFPAKKYGVAAEIALGSETVRANGVLLMSLLYNLADNAFKSCESGGRVRICSCAEGGRVRIVVADNGRGIAKENLELVKEPFFREDKARSRRMGGAGLGLSLCKRICELHGSELTINSEPGVGTAVSFTIEREEDRM